MIAPSKLGHLILQTWHSDAALIHALREKQLVRADVPDMLLAMTVTRAREEHEAIPEGQRDFNSPHERVRVFLAPYLTWKGRRWAVPLKSLKLPDDDAGYSWWQVWRWGRSR